MEKVKDNYWHYAKFPLGERLPCPKCPGTMLPHLSSIVMTSNPPQQRWYWECASCGYDELGGIHTRVATQK